MNNRKNRTAFRFPTGPLMLMTAALIWGTAFVAQAMGMDHLGPCTFNAVRSFIGGFVLLPAAVFLVLRDRKGERAGVPLGDVARPLLLGGLICGTLLGVASLLQQSALQTVSSGKAGFLTALYIVLVPVLGCFAGRRPGKRAWVAVAVAVIGTWLLSMTPGEFSIAAGDLLLLGCAFLFSLHILAIDHFLPKVNGVALSCCQFFVAGIVSFVPAFLAETPQWENVLLSTGPLLYTGVLSSGVAYTLQILGQKTTGPTASSLILSLESVFAALAGWAVLKDVLSGRELIGCCLVFCAVILTQLPGRKKEETNEGTTVRNAPDHSTNE